MYVWWVVVITALLAALGFTLEFTGVSPGAINMGVGAGILSVALLTTAVYCEWDRR